jgi:hypothetical protein
MTDLKTNKDASTLITLQLDTGEREFQTIEEIQEWINAEQSFFSWMKTGSQNDGNAAHAWNVTNQWLSFVNEFIQRYYQHQNNEAQLQSIKRSLLSHIDQHLQKGHLITSKNPDAIFGKNLSGEEDEVIACYAIANLLNIPSNQNHPKALKGAFYAFQYRQGSTATVKSQAESLISLSTEWNGRFTQQQRDLRAQNEALIEEIGSLRDTFTNLKQEISEQKEEQVTAFNSQIEQLKKTLSDIAKTYDEKLALQASVQYWSGKRTSHTKVMGWVGGVTLILAALTGASFIWAAYKLLQVTASEVELWRFGVMIAISTFGIWITRLAAKIFISNLHLRTDADERVTMIQTYLALLREGSGPKDEERQLILQTLFRPSTTGFIKDEGPSAFHEMVANALSKK